LQGQLSQHLVTVFIAPYRCTYSLQRYLVAQPQNLQVAHCCFGHRQAPRLTVLLCGLICYCFVRGPVHIGIAGHTHTMHFCSLQIQIQGTKIQGGHSPGKPGKVREFQSGQGKVGENGKSQGNIYYLGTLNELKS